MDDRKELDLLREREEKRRERVKRQNERFNSTVDRLTFTVPKGEKENISRAAKMTGAASVNEYISKVVLRDVKKQFKKHLENNL